MSLVSFQNVFYVLAALGAYRVVEVVNDLATWTRSLLPIGTVNKTAEIANSTLHDYSKIRGVWDAAQSCPWPLTNGSGTCYLAGFHKNPFGKTLSTLYCFLNERGFTNKASCVLGLDESAQRDLEEKIQVIAGIALLMGLWYLTSSNKNEKKNKSIRHEDRIVIV